VIANSGIGDVYAPAYQTTIEDVQGHFAVNTLGPLRLFQAMRSLLSSSTRVPKFVILSTAIASIELTTTFPLQTAAYGASKTAINFICRRIHAEEDWLVAFPISPGYVAILVSSWFSDMDASIQMGSNRDGQLRSRCLRFESGPNEY